MSSVSAAAYHRRLLDISQRMLSAGMAQRWDELVELEQQRREMFEQAPRTASGTLQPADRELLEQIRSCDTELNEKLEAWLTHVRILLRMDKPASPDA